jgi:hypothetical protein
MSTKPMVFVAMPFGKKKDRTGIVIDFDAIYERGIKPAVSTDIFDCIRADEERGGGIIHQAMFERLLLAEIAIVDVTIDNPNVYYELGVRHAARPRSTIIIRAGEGPLPFDINLIRTVSYPLENGMLTEAGAVALQAVVAAKLLDARHDGVARDSPLFQLIPQFPGIDLPHTVTESFRDRARTVNSVRDRLVLAVHNRSVEQIEAVEADANLEEPSNAEVFVDVLLAYRDLEAWDHMIRLAERCSALLASAVTLREQYALALNRRNQGDDRRRALGLLEEIVAAKGDSPETCGIVGRIYKDRYRVAVEEARKTGTAPGRQARADLAQACAWYRRGFMADPRDYYPGVNLATLLTFANTDESLAELRTILPAVSFAVARLGGIESQDYWQVATVMELGVDGNDFVTAERALTRLLGLDVPPMALNSMADQLGSIRNVDPSAIDCARLDEFIAELRAAAVVPSRTT